MSTRDAFLDAYHRERAEVRERRRRRLRAMFSRLVRRRRRAAPELALTGGEDRR